MYPLLAIALPAFMVGPVISLLLPAVVGAVASALYQWIKKGVDWIDSRDPKVHEYIMGAVAIVLPALGQVVDGLPADIHGFTPQMVQSLVLLAATKLTHKFLAGPNKA